jgi:hypothetical protein
MTVVLNLQQLVPTILYCDRNLCCTRINAVLQHLLESTGGPLHHLASRDAVDNVFI